MATALLMGGHDFNPDKDIPDLTGKVIIVTGGNSGLGLETIRHIAKHSPAHVYLAGRSKERGEKAIEQLRKEGASISPISYLPLDLSSGTEGWAPKDTTYQFDKLKTTMPETPSRYRYGISKLANIHYAAAGVVY